jgi:hypothetical protein
MGELVIVIIVIVQTFRQGARLAGICEFLMGQCG